MNENVRKITRLGMLAALSVALAALVHFPLMPAAAYLEYDPADIPILISAFLYGPWYGVAITAVVSLVQGLTVSAAGGPIGIIMHIVSTGAVCLVSGYIYKTHRSIKGARISLLAGVLVMCAVMARMNYLLTPLYTGMPREQVAQMLIPIIIPFNLIKASINALLTYLVYKPIRRFLDRIDGRRAHAAEKQG
ncbi:MAG: ECF transporter S component [Oscillospiraceae bacterium]|nr:ECF transporter S component [Oscillospiraceae bacterium]